MIRIAIANDHRGLKIKNRLVQLLSAQKGMQVMDQGVENETACDYPDYGCRVAEMVSRGDADRGILICGTGIGMAIVANKYTGVRAAPCYDEVMVELSRRHNDLNVLCLPGDLLGDRPIDDMVLMWLRTQFEGGRHETRVQKISKIESINPVGGR
ncbi:MAG: ribose 5-phosphate isomerase B [Planctomycetota bacterium]